MTTIRRAFVLQQVSMEGPVRVAEVCREHGIAVETFELSRAAKVPKALPDDALLVVMGGPMSVSDRHDPRYRFLDDEILLLEKVIAANGPVLGLCLGAQLLARAAGARVYPNLGPNADGKSELAREVGWGPIVLHGRDTEPALAGLSSPMTVLHWHGETFDLPAGAARLASSALCANQAFRVGDRGYGLQFHIEMNAETVVRWAREDAKFIRKALGPDGVQRVLSDNARYAEQALPACDRLLRNILARLIETT